MKTPGLLKKYPKELAIGAAALVVVFVALKAKSSTGGSGSSGMVQVGTPSVPAGAAGADTAALQASFDNQFGQLNSRFDQLGMIPAASNNYANSDVTGQLGGFFSQLSAAIAGAFPQPAAGSSGPGGVTGPVVGPTVGPTGPVDPVTTTTPATPNSQSGFYSTPSYRVTAGQTVVPHGVSL